jgi:hypothetical protein
MHFPMTKENRVGNEILWNKIDVALSAMNLESRSLRCHWGDKKQGKT